jgi:TonB-dependent SusC/RagA subfamily outer membrane receptor
MKTKATLLILAFLLSAATYGQKSSISGKVTDTSQQPVKGVSILLDGKDTGKKTNKQGIFKIKTDQPAKTIAIKDVAGQTMEQEIAGRNEINFSVSSNFAVAKQPKQPDAVQPADPNDEQVNIGYGTVSKRNLTTPVTKVNSAQHAGQYTDIYEMLRGKPGVQVVGKTIKIQGGVNSINSGTDPLLVVDGVIVSSIDGILPQEVKSIEVLKGSSASIYGSRGANGVIMITLKK